MKRHAKAASAGTAKGRHQTRDRFRPANRLFLALAAALALALVLGVALASAVVPTVTVEDASSVSYTTAHVKGEVDPQGEETSCHFEYISQGQLDENLVNGFSEWEFAGGADCGAPLTGTGLQTVDADLGDLAPSTVYHLRLVASNESGPSEAVAASTFETKAVGPATVAIDPVTTFTGTTAHFTGTINPNAPEAAPAGDEVEAAFAAHWHFQCTPDCPGLEGTVAADNTSHPVDADAKGLEPNTTYEVKLVSSNRGGQAESGMQSFHTTAVAPTAQTIPAFVLEGGTNALVGGRVNPRNSATTYWIEYGTGTSYGTSVPAGKDASAGSGGEAQALTQEITGLALDTTYHFRIVAKNGVDEVKGEDLTFTTPQPAPSEGPCPNAEFRVGPSATLPECRAFELASSPDLGGYSVSPLDIGSSVNALTPKPYSAVASDGDAVLWKTDAIVPGVDSAGTYDTYLSRRSKDGWNFEFVAPPGSKRTPTVGGQFLTYATPDLSRLLWQTAAATIDPTDPDPDDQIGSQGFRDLYRRDPDGTFVRVSQGPAEQAELGQTGNFYPAVSADALHVAFVAGNKSLVPGAPFGSAYVRTGASTTWISINHPPAVGTLEGQVVFAISDDGGTVAYGDGSQGKSIWLRTDGLSRDVTVADTTAQPFSGGHNVEALSPDGNTLLYRSPYQETGDDADGQVDLYEFDLATETKHRLSAPTGSPSGPGPGNEDSCSNSWTGNCQAQLVTSTKDLSGIYFVSPELLDGDRGISGAPNLYRRFAGETDYITTLDTSDEAFKTQQNGSAFHAVQLTPDQSKLIFQSSARISAYDNAGMSEIYVFDPAANQITCASCRLDGSQPTGESTLRTNQRTGATASMPAPVTQVASDDAGDRIFFATTDALRPDDTDSARDIYVADLQHGSESLIGNISGDQANYFWGAGGDGRDIFIVSTSRLSAEERSVGAYKVYDARVGGGFPAAPPPASETCQGDDCHGLGSALPGSLGSSTSHFEGPQDPKPTHKKPHKKKHKKSKKHGKGKRGDKNRAGHKGRNHR